MTRLAVAGCEGGLASTNRTVWYNIFTHVLHIIHELLSQSHKQEELFTINISMTMILGHRGWPWATSRQHSLCMAFRSSGKPPFHHSRIISRGEHGDTSTDSDISRSLANAVKPSRSDSTAILQSLSSTM